MSKVKDFYDKEDCSNNEKYNSPKIEWYYSHNDIMLFAEKYKNDRINAISQKDFAKEYDKYTTSAERYGFEGGVKWFKNKLLKQ